MAAGDSFVTGTPTSGEREKLWEATGPLVLVKVNQCFDMRLYRACRPGRWPSSSEPSKPPDVFYLAI